MQTVATKIEKQAALSEFLTRISQSLPLAEFYKEIFPTNEMKTVVASMYVQIVDLLERATKYYCSGLLGIAALREVVQ